MSLDRKDVRFKLAPDMHSALTVLADCAQVDIGEFVESLVEREVLRRVHTAKIVAERTACLGISGIAGAPAGKSGNRYE